jgi:hypothetical protein
MVWSDGLEIWFGGIRAQETPTKPMSPPAWQSLIIMPQPLNYIVGQRERMMALGPRGGTERWVAVGGWVGWGGGWMLGWPSKPHKHEHKRRGGSNVPNVSNEPVIELYVHIQYHTTQARAGTVTLPGTPISLGVRPAPLVPPATPCVLSPAPPSSSPCRPAFCLPSLRPSWQPPAGLPPRAPATPRSAPCVLNP